MAIELIECDAAAHHIFRLFVQNVSVYLRQNLTDFIRDDISLHLSLISHF